MTTRKHPHDPLEPEVRSETVDGPDSRAVASMEDKIAELESALAETKDRYLRLAADFDNFKKRTRQGQLDTIQHGSADCCPPSTTSARRSTIGRRALTRPGSRASS